MYSSSLYLILLHLLIQKIHSPDFLVIVYSLYNYIMFLNQLGFYKIIACSHILKNKILYGYEYDSLELFDTEGLS